MDTRARVSAVPASASVAPRTQGHQDRRRPVLRRIPVSAAPQAQGHQDRGRWWSGSVWCGLFRRPSNPGAPRHPAAHGQPALAVSAPSDPGAPRPGSAAPASTSRFRRPSTQGHKTRYIVAEWVAWFRRPSNAEAPRPRRSGMPVSWCFRRPSNAGAPRRGRESCPCQPLFPPPSNAGAPRQALVNSMTSLAKIPSGAGIPTARAMQARPVEAVPSGDGGACLAARDTTVERRPPCSRGR